MKNCKNCGHELQEENLQALHLNPDDEKKGDDEETTEECPFC